MTDDALGGGSAGEPAGQDVTVEPVITTRPDVPLVSGDDFMAVLRSVQDAAREWGVRPDLMEGKFISALLGAMEWLGRINHAAQAEFRQIAQKQSDVAQVELARAKELTKATGATLSQARSALINLQIERENVVVRMIQETMPTFAKELRKVLVIRAQDETDGRKLLRVALAGVAALAIFLGGFGLSTWETWEDHEAAVALKRCLAKALRGQGVAEGHLYCDVTSFGEPDR